MNKKIAENFKAIRKALSLSVWDFGERLKISGSYVSSIENEKRKPSDRLVESLFVVFNVNRDWWDTGEGEIFAEKRNQKAPYFPTPSQHDDILAEANEYYRTQPAMSDPIIGDEETLIKMLRDIPEEDGNAVKTILQVKWDNWRKGEKEE